VISNKVGLHARPAALFVKTAASFTAKVTLENLTRGTKPVNAKSILSVLGAAAKMDDRIRITADGNDEEAAVAALSELVNTRFGEAE
jgi:phosphotransferase system HPr (HPr) family protein